MYTSLHLLPQYDPTDRDKYFDRWHEKQGAKTRKYVMELIKRGAGEDFLLYDFQVGNLAPMEHERDLRGMWIGRMDMEFPEGDNFEGIDFSFAVFSENKFSNAVFLSCSFAFSRLTQCEFRKCVFVRTGFYGASLKDVKFIDCDFIEYFSFGNSDFSGVHFKGCFLQKPLFADCWFDETVEFIDLSTHQNYFPQSESIKQDKRDLADIYKGIKDAYRQGDAIDQMRRYYLLERQSLTRHNRTGMKKLTGFFLEAIAGYGVKPMNTLLILVLVFLVFTFPYVYLEGMALPDALLFSAGSFLSFGYQPEYLTTAGAFLKLWYASEAFMGILLSALFITVLARYWFEER